MDLHIVKVEALPARFRREEAYLGSLPPGAGEASYFVRPPYRALYSAYFETVFVKITAADGTVGWGEALAPVAPEAVAKLIEQLLAPILMGKDPRSHDHLWSVMYGLMRERGHYGGFMLDAISACDIALWDLSGKLLDEPLFRLLGGPHREHIPCYVSGLPKPTDPERVALALSWAERGFSAFKLAAGFGVNADRHSLAALRGALGPGAPLLLDAHWVYGLDEAVALGRHLEALDVAAFEAPLNPEDVEGHAKLADAVAVPVAIGETERTRHQFKPWLLQRGADILQPDVGRTGITELLKIASMAEAFNIPVAPHLSVGLGPCIAASIHIAAAIPNFFLLEYQPPVFELANALLIHPLECLQGRYTLPNTPGIGVVVDEKKLANLQA